MTCKDDQGKQWDKKNIYEIEPTYTDKANIVSEVNATTTYDARDELLFSNFEEMIQEQGNFYQVLMDHVVAGVFVVKDHKFMYVNSYFAQLLGYTVQCLLGKPVDQFIREDDWLVPQSFNGILDNEVTKHQIIRWHGLHINHSTIYLEGKSTMINYKGEIAYLATVQDVTLKYEKEIELIQHAKMYQRMLMMIPEPIYITIDGMIIFANRHGLDLLKSKYISALLDKSLVDYFVEDEQEEILNELQLALKLEEATSFKQKHIKVGEQIIDLEVASVKIENYIGKTAVLTVMRDLTERREGEERMIRSEKLSVIGQLAAGVAHEIRNPLTALKGFTQLLRNRYSEHSYYFDIMGTEIDRINLIVNEFMTLAKPHYNSYEYNDIVLILQSVLSIVDTQAVLLGVEIDFKPQQELPKLYCNENQLKQVFLNVIKNALEAMPTGGTVTLTIRNDDTDQSMHVQIKDQGEGMSEEVMKRIGEPFLTTKDKGTGLGLMVSSRIIEEHRGTMNIGSSPGKGTLIDIQLPIHK